MYKIIPNLDYHDDAISFSVMKRGHECDRTVSEAEAEFVVLYLEACAEDERLFPPKPWSEAAE